MLRLHLLDCLKQRWDVLAGLYAFLPQRLLLLVGESAQEHIETRQCSDPLTKERTDKMLQANVAAITLAVSERDTSGMEHSSQRQNQR